MGAVPVADRADRTGQRGDLRRPAAVTGSRRGGPWPAGAKRGLLSQELAARLAAEAAAEVTRLAGAAAASVAGGAGLEAAERAIRAGLLRLGASVLEDLLAADAGYAGPQLDCGAGHLAVFTGYRDKNADTVLGPVTIGRAWYHCAACGHGFAPRDAQLGVSGETMSPGLRKMTARAAAAVPFAAAARLVGELAGISLTGKRTGRRAEADGNAAAAVIEAEAAAITARAVLPMPPAGPLPGKLYVAIDGTGVPMTAAGTEGRAGKGEDGRARTREVKMAAAFTQTAVDEQGYPVRDPGSSSYLATLAAAPQFGILMAAEARRRGAGHIRQLTILGDGAPWIWNLASQHFPEATQIAGLFHAREHVHDLANLAGRCWPATATNGSANAWPSSTPATPGRSSPRAVTCGSAARWPASATRPCTTSKPTPTACTMPGTAPWASSSAPASSKPDANPSSGSDSSSPA